jgi:autophagy-related protein 9
MHNFYLYLLDIPDRDIQTVSWQYVVSRLMALRDGNPSTATNISAANRRFIQSQSKQRMDAHDIANRLMRRDNFWIAMINKDILDCSLNIPFFGKRSFYSRVLQWNISLCLMDFVFDEKGQVRQQFRETRHRREVIKVLKSRFRTAGLINMVFVIPLVVWAVGYRFLTSFTVCSFCSRYSFGR